MISAGSIVSFHYTLKVEGETVDTSIGGDPLTYEQGKGQMIPGLEEEVAGLAKGDKKSFSVWSEKGYGSHKPEVIQKLPRNAFKDEDILKVGEVVAGEIKGQPFQAKIVEVATEEVTLDFNHPLTGKTLDFEVEIVGIQGE